MTNCSGTGIFVRPDLLFQPDKYFVLAVCERLVEYNRAPVNHFSFDSNRDIRSCIFYILLLWYICFSPHPVKLQISRYIIR